MGPWGLHYERTQTWWEMSTGWHTYLTRCQYLLRQGRFMADLLYLRPQVPDLGYYDPSPGVPAGYKYDDISAGALQQRVRVQDGRLTLPDGLQYRVLVLPANDHLMTPELVRHLETLVRAGAILYGPPPTASPSLPARKLASRYTDSPLTASRMWPSSERAACGSKTTGTRWVATLRAPRRRRVRCAALRPTASPMPWSPSTRPAPASAGIATSRCSAMWSRCLSCRPAACAFAAAPAKPGVARP